DRVLELAEYIGEVKEVHRDPFVNERRFEQRFPEFADYVSTWMQGYEKNCESALAILAFLEENFEVKGALTNTIRELCV
ncbi:MAG TPA: hypothetical protein VFH34_10590, partial [Anaerolineales bacterium]|nr:hypothetical protein [Anaerolineales bacterium]